MKTSIADLKKETKETIKPLLQQMNTIVNYNSLQKNELTIGTKKTKLVVNDYGYPSFYLEKTDIIDNQLIISVCFHRVKNHGHNHQEIIPVQAVHTDYQEYLVPIYQEMKKYWERYAASSNIDTVLFVKDHRLDDSWVPLLQMEQFSEEDVFFRDLLNQTQSRFALLEGSFSKLFKHKVIQLQQIIDTLEYVVTKVTLLKRYKEGFNYLFHGGIVNINYASKRMHLMVQWKDSDGFIAFKDLIDNNIVSFSFHERQGIIDYLEQLKLEQRLANALDFPKNNFLDVLSKMGISYYYSSFSPPTPKTLSIKELSEAAFEKLENKYGWEFVESEMSEVLLKDNLLLTQHFSNVLNEYEYKLFTFHSNQYWYYAIIEFRKHTPVDLNVFCSNEEHNEEAYEYFFTKIKNSTNS